MGHVAAVSGRARAETIPSSSDQQDLPNRTIKIRGVWDRAVGAPDGIKFRREAADLLPDTGDYALAYGSHATDTHQPTSDLDLLYTGPHPLDDTGLTAAVVAPHHCNGLDLDEEVPYPVKLYATGDQVAQAAALAGFQLSWGTPAPTSARPGSGAPTPSSSI
ncbi:MULTISPECIES: nucleotidyltransferase domain-containing protein [unclassified Streptomyces]|uniref:nucleotidyltransferase domain-containing protein n=1 Tax=unclassified Streptomyces TaxID=2593676 RepID=UPI0035E0D359